MNNELMIMMLTICQYRQNSDGSGLRSVQANIRIVEKNMSNVTEPLYDHLLKVFLPSKSPGLGQMLKRNFHKLRNTVQD